MPGRAAGVEDVEVVARAGPEVPLLGLVRQRVLVADRPGRRFDVAAVLDHDQVPKLRELGKERRHERRELPLVDERLQVGVGQQVPELVLDVAVVDVDPDGPQLEDGPCGLDPLDRVVGVNADVVPRPDSLRRQMMGQAVGPRLHLGVGPPLAVGHQVLTLRVGVDGRLEQVGEVELHRHEIRTRSHSSGNRPRPSGVAPSGVPHRRPPSSGVPRAVRATRRSPRWACST